MTSPFTRTTTCRPVGVTVIGWASDGWRTGRSVILKPTYAPVVTIPARGRLPPVGQPRDEPLQTSGQGLRHVVGIHEVVLRQQARLAGDRFVGEPAQRLAVPAE